MAYEWYRWPDGSVFLGPLGLIWYNGLEIDGLIISAVSVCALFAFPVMPRSITAAISLFGMLNWVFWGFMALGIGV
jgi:hypothetical protein